MAIQSKSVSFTCQCGVVSATLPELETHLHDAHNVHNPYGGGRFNLHSKGMTSTEDGYPVTILSWNLAGYLVQERIEYRPEEEDTGEEDPEPSKRKRHKPKSG